MLNNRLSVSLMRILREGERGEQTRQRHGGVKEKQPEFTLHTKSCDEECFLF